jgi:hypothetical protein
MQLDRLVVAEKCVMRPWSCVGLPIGYEPMLADYAGRVGFEPATGLPQNGS